MNTQSNAMPESFGPMATPPMALAATRPLYWSIARELWENRSLYVAPVVVAGVVLIGYLFRLLFWSHHSGGAAANMAGQAPGSEFVQTRRRDWTAERRYLAKADVVEQDDHDIGRSVGRSRQLWPFGNRVLVRLTDLATEGRFWHWQS